jgi:hypothetical protein
VPETDVEELSTGMGVPVGAGGGCELDGEESYAVRVGTYPLVPDLTGEVLVPRGLPTGGSGLDVLHRSAS